MLDNPTLTAFINRIQPLGFPGRPAAPVYDYHATGDEFAPITSDRQLMARHCAAGVRVQHVETPVGGHLTELPVGITGALNYLRDRFLGLTAPSNCSSARH